MAIDALARGMAAAAGGGGGVDVGIDAGTGIRFTGTDPVTIINTGVTAVTTPGDNDVAEDGTIKVANPGAENSADRVHYVKVKGINNAAFKDIDTVINDTKATSTNVPTTKAVYDELVKKLEAEIDTTAFTNDNDHVPSSKLVKEKLDDKLDNTLEINGVSYDSTNDSYTLDGDDIDLAGYTAISSGTEEDVAATDSVNDAIAKVEYKADNRIPTDNIDADFPVSPDADHVLASTVASATFQGTGTAGVSPKKGLVPAPGATSGTETRYLKADGTWATPPNTEYSEGTGIDISNAGVISNTGVTHIENSDPADDNVANGTFKVMENGTAKWIAIKGLDDAAYKDVDGAITSGSTSTNLPTTQAVADFVDTTIANLEKPVIFKGTVGTGGTVTSLPTAQASTRGYEYQAITAGTIPAAQSASGSQETYDIGDMLICALTSAEGVTPQTFGWVVNPSGDEPDGTVTNLTAEKGIVAYSTDPQTTGAGTIATQGKFFLNLKNDTQLTNEAVTGTDSSDRLYPTALDKNGKLATNVPWTDTTYEFADSYNASTNKGATVATVTNAIGELDVTGTNAFGAGKTISSWSETDGKVNITSQDISITGSQISDIDTAMPSTAADTKVPSTKLVKTQLSGKQDTLTFDGTYNASTNKAATVSTVTNAINALDVSAVTVGATKTLTSISQTNGKISATATDIQSASTSQKGLVQLNNSLTSTSTTQAATANAVKTVNDKAETNQTNILSVLDVLGSKNFVPETITFVQQYIVPLPKIKGRFILHADNVTSNDTDASTCRSIIYLSNGSTIDKVFVRNTSTTMAVIDTGNLYLDHINLYSSDTYSHGRGDTVTYSGLILCLESAWNTSNVVTPQALPNYDLTRMVSELQKKAVKVYTYHVNPNESDPEDAVTYLDDATGLTPAKMGASSFSYGSWANAWFLPKPCVLKFDGTVDYYLNPNDYSKKTDGTASTIDSSNSTGNVMLEFPKIWVKRVNDGNGARTVSIAPVNVDGTYKCWSNINAEDKEVDHFYLPAYNGTIHSSKMRSLSGVTLNSTYAPNYTRAQEVTAATANNPTGKNLWYTETWADFCLIYDLLYLMGKSLDVQRTFGQGLSSGSETAMRAYVTGTHNAKGLFYGDVSGTSTAVKVLGMENLWGCRWHGVAGLINDNGTLKVKMTYGVADGSTTVGYNTTGSGYLNYGSTYGTNGYVKKMQADNTMGYKIIETAGTDATYYCDYYYTNNSQSTYALLGGGSGDGADCGFYVALHRGAAYTSWAVGGSLSCRP